MLLDFAPQPMQTVNFDELLNAHGMSGDWLTWIDKRIYRLRDDVGTFVSISVVFWMSMKLAKTHHSPGI